MYCTGYGSSKGGTPKKKDQRRNADGAETNKADSERPFDF